MLSNRAAMALFDIRDNIALAREFTAGKTLEGFIVSRQRFYATTRALEIISEAARRLPASFHEAHSNLPWKKIMGIGNVLRHNYETVVENDLWDPVHRDLDPLPVVISAAIEELQR